MDDATTGQLTTDAAQVYDRFFVPALFAEWAPRLAEAAELASGHRVLDVACGSGVFALEATRRVGPDGTVVGLDCNAGMLEVARGKSGSVDWQEGFAESLTFPAGRFDAAVCQFGLMFFEDRPRSLAEMWRMLRPGGRLAVSVWDSLDQTPGYDAMHGLLDRLFGSRASGPLEAPFALGDKEALMTIFQEAGIPNVQIETIQGKARFPSLDSWVYTDIKGWTLADVLNEDEYQRLQEAARTELETFVQPDGTVAFPSPAHIVTAQRPGP